MAGSRRHAHAGEFAQLLRTQRAATGLTQEQLADRAGLSARSIVNLEAGHVRQPRPPSVRLLADALGLRGTARSRFEEAGRHGRPQPRPSATAPPDRHPPSPVGPPPQPASTPAVSQLPRDIPDFTGRSAEIAQLTEALIPPAQAAAATATALPVVVLTGPGGIGKTALAVRVAHLLRRRFPDGQLYLDLRATHPNPRTPADALHRLRRALGHPRADLAATPDEDAEQMRRTLADRRILIVLDDAGSVDQVRDLLPGHAGCAVLVTSRRRLGGLVGVAHLDLDLPTHQEALQLLAHIAGPDRLAADRAATDQLVELCGRLPLAIRAAGARLLAHPTWPPTRLLARLTDAHHRLDELSVDGLDIRATVTASYRAIRPEAQRALHDLAALDPPYTASAAAALLHVPTTAALDLLDELTESRLLTTTPPVSQCTHYTMHPLIRDYAQEQPTSDHPQARRTPHRVGAHERRHSAEIRTLEPRRSAAPPTAPPSEYPASRDEQQR